RTPYSPVRGAPPLVPTPPVADQCHDAASPAPREHLGNEHERSPDVGPGGAADAAARARAHEAHRRYRRGIRNADHSIDDVRQERRLEALASDAFDARRPAGER